MKKRIVFTILLTLAMGFGIFTGCGTEEEKPKIPSSAEAKNISEEKNSSEAEKALGEESKTAVTIQITADEGWNQNSMPAIVHIVSKDKTGDPDFYHAVSPEEDQKGASVVELAEGTYTLEWISPVNEDGSVYEIEQNPQDYTVKADSEGNSGINCIMKRIPADQVTEEMIRDIGNKTKAAVEKGDYTLSGDAGTAILETLDRNRKNRPEEANQAEENQAEITGKQGKEDGDKGEQDSPNGAGKNGAGGNKSEGNKSNNSSNNSSNNTHNETTSDRPSSTEPSGSTEPPHEHVWQEHTATRQEWIPNIVVVDDYEVQTVVVGSVIHCNCGVEIPAEDRAANEEHALNHILNGEDDGCWTVEKTEEQQVKVGSHEEDHGHYETVTYVD